MRNAGRAPASKIRAGVRRRRRETQRRRLETAIACVHLAEAGDAPHPRPIARCACRPPSVVDTPTLKVAPARAKDLDTVGRGPRRVRATSQGAAVQIPPDGPPVAARSPAAAVLEGDIVPASIQEHLPVRTPGKRVARRLANGRVKPGQKVLTRRPISARPVITGVVGKPPRGRRVAPARVTRAVLEPIQHRPPSKAPAIAALGPHLTIHAPPVPSAARTAAAKSL